MAAKIPVAFFRFDGSACELGRTLFGEEPVTLLGGTPIVCAEPAPGSIVDVSLPTFAGVNPQRIKARAYVQGMGRIMGDEGLSVYAVRGEVPADHPLELDAAGLLELEDAFLPRLCRQNDNAATIAHYLRCHPAVAEVRYPGFKDDARFDAAAQLLVHGFGNAIDYLREGSGSWERIVVLDGDPFDQMNRLEALLGV